MSPTPQADALVIGGGVVGLAVARALALAGREVFVLEADDRAGQGQSSRNSEVIHAGIYYPPGSLKAELCTRGRERLYAYCDRHRIGYREIGKLIVATGEAEHDRLRALQHNAAQNGVDLEWLEADQVQELEPSLAVTAALHSPETGIIDSHELMETLIADLESAGGQVVVRSSVARVLSGPRVELSDGALIGARLIVNAAGLGAVDLLERSGVATSAMPRIGWVKGSYFSFARRSPCDRLVYPLPDEHGLGIHLTLDLAGQARFGPDAEVVDRIDYSVDGSRLEPFVAAIRRYLPDVDAADLQPAYAGIRTSAADGDFHLLGPAEQGIEGLVSLL
ncbi:MAG: NAD(P)/FAD-dependent oxidoreductase, partial [Xanthomonadales bacterium]|nr:NAD(P)/FAD-dependent oxidoreductase [Xanthomonadales bacterium]